MVTGGGGWTVREVGLYCRAPNSIVLETPALLGKSPESSRSSGIRAEKEGHLFFYCMCPLVLPLSTTIASITKLISSLTQYTVPLMHSLAISLGDPCG